MNDKDLQINVKTKADIKGLQEADQAVDELADSNKQLRAAIDGANDITEEQRQELMSLADTTEDLGNRSKDLVKKSEEINQGNKKVTKSTRNTGLAVLEASRAFEDLQFGFTGVLNNIPGIIRSLGGTAGLTGVVSILAVSIFALSKRMGSLGTGLSKLQKKIEAEADAMRESSRQARKAAEEKERLEKSVKDFSDAIDEEIKALDDETAALERSARASDRKLQAQISVLDSALGAKVAEIQANEKLSRLEQTIEIERVKRLAEQKKQELELAGIAQDRADNREREAKALKNLEKSRELREKGESLKVSRSSITNEVEKRRDKGAVASESIEDLVKDLAKAARTQFDIGPDSSRSTVDFGKINAESFNKKPRKIIREVQENLNELREDALEPGRFGAFSKTKVSKVEEALNNLIKVNDVFRKTEVDIESIREFAAAENKKSEKAFSDADRIEDKAKTDLEKISESNDELDLKENASNKIFENNQRSNEFISNQRIGGLRDKEEEDNVNEAKRVEEEQQAEIDRIQSQRDKVNSEAIAAGNQVLRTLQTEVSKQGEAKQFDQLSAGLRASLQKLEDGSTVRELRAVVNEVNRFGQTFKVLDEARKGEVIRLRATLEKQSRDIKTLSSQIKNART